MIVFCEECGARNEVSPESFNDETEPARCASCFDILNKATAQKLRILMEARERKAREEEAKCPPPEPEPEPEAVEAEPQSGILEPVVHGRPDPACIDVLDYKVLNRNMDIDEL